MEIKSKTTKVSFTHQGETAKFNGSYELDTDNAVSAIEAAILIDGAQKGSMTYNAQNSAVNLWDGVDSSVMAEASVLIAFIIANPLPEQAEAAE